jgi:hypothetical protein
VKTDHARTIVASTTRGPALSPQRPAGTAKRPYARVNAAFTSPISEFDSPSSFWIGTTAFPMQMRSR